MRVRWNSLNSREFLLSNGVKQVYLDDLLCELRHVNVGCHMNGYFVGVVFYADDITLLSHTRSSISSMLNVCDVYHSPLNTEPGVSLFYYPIWPPGRLSVE